MEKGGVRIDTGVLAASPSDLAAELERVGESIFELAGRRFNINSPKQLGEVLFTHMGLPPPGRQRQRQEPCRPRKMSSSDLRRRTKSRAWFSNIRHLSKLKSNYIDSLPLLADADSRVHTTFQAAATSTGRLSSVNPNLQNIPIRTELGREIRAAFIAAPGTATALCGLLADRAAAYWRTSAAIRCLCAPTQRRRHPHAYGQRSFRRPDGHHGQGDAQSRQGRELWHRLRHFALSVWQRNWGFRKLKQGLHRPILCALSGREGIHREDTRDKSPRGRRTHALRPNATRFPT